MTRNSTTPDIWNLARQLRGKQIALSGLMASGKSTAVEQLARRLEACGLTVQVTRFRPLYPSFHLPTLRGGLRGRPSSGRVERSTASNKFRPSTIQWNKRFGVTHFLNNLCPIVVVYCLRLLRRRSVTLFDRYFYDHYIHYRPSGVWYRLARWMSPRPDIAFVLQTPAETLVSRTSERLRQATHSGTELNGTEQQALVLAGKQYERLAQQWPHVIGITMDSASDHESLWSHVLELVDDHLMNTEPHNSAELATTDSDPSKRDSCENKKPPAAATPT